MKEHRSERHRRLWTAVEGGAKAASLPGQAGDVAPRPPSSMAPSPPTLPSPSVPSRTISAKAAVPAAAFVFKDADFPPLLGSVPSMPLTAWPTVVETINHLANINDAGRVADSRGDGMDMFTPTTVPDPRRPGKWMVMYQAKQTLPQFAVDKTKAVPADPRTPVEPADNERRYSVAAEPPRLPIPAAQPILLWDNPHYNQESSTRRPTVRVFEEHRFVRDRMSDCWMEERWPAWLKGEECKAVSTAGELTSEQPSPRGQAPARLVATRRFNKVTKVTAMAGRKGVNAATSCAGAFVINMFAQLTLTNASCEENEATQPHVSRNWKKMRGADGKEEKTRGKRTRRRVLKAAAEIRADIEFLRFSMERTPIVDCSADAPPRQLTGTDEYASPKNALQLRAVLNSFGMETVTSLCPALLVDQHRTLPGGDSGASVSASDESHGASVSDEPATAAAPSSAPPPAPASNPPLPPPSLPTPAAPAVLPAPPALLDETSAMLSGAMPSMLPMPQQQQQQASSRLCLSSCASCSSSSRSTPISRTTTWMSRSSSSCFATSSCGCRTQEALEDFENQPNVEGSDGTSTAPFHKSDDRQSCGGDRGGSDGKMVVTVPDEDDDDVVALVSGLRECDLENYVSSRPSSINDDVKEKERGRGKREGEEEDEQMEIVEQTIRDDVMVEDEAGNLADGFGLSGDGRMAAGSSPARARSLAGVVFHSPPADCFTFWAERFPKKNGGAPVLRGLAWSITSGRHVVVPGITSRIGLTMTGGCDTMTVRYQLLSMFGADRDCISMDGAAWAEMDKHCTEREHERKKEEMNVHCAAALVPPRSHLIAFNHLDKA